MYALSTNPLLFYKLSTTLKTKGNGNKVNLYTQVSSDLQNTSLTGLWAKKILTSNRKPTVDILRSFFPTLDMQGSAIAVHLFNQLVN